jgi:hypothetical protein
MLEKIVNIQPKEVNSNSSTGETRDKIVQNIANDMLSKLPANFIQHEVYLTDNSLEFRSVFSNRYERNYEIWVY